MSLRNEGVKEKIIKKKLTDFERRQFFIKWLFGDHVTGATILFSVVPTLFKKNFVKKH